MQTSRFQAQVSFYDTVFLLPTPEMIITLSRVTLDIWGMCGWKGINLRGILVNSYLLVVGMNQNSIC